MARDFRPIFRGIPPLLREGLTADLHDFRWAASSWQAKAWFGNREIHYEIWVRYRAKVVELGLHFESDALTNARLYGAFRSRAKDVKRALGGDARIEQWDKGWTRVWEPLPLESIDDAYTERIQKRFVVYVRSLEPILRDELPSEVEWKIARPRRAARGSYSRASR
jgi:hypothetical protein